MARVETLTNRTIAQRFREVKDEEGLWGEISWETQQLVKRIVETTAEEEMAECLGAGRYERNPHRRGWRNGYYDRSFLTRWGFIDLHLPRARTDQPASLLLPRFRRREHQVDELIRQAFLRGVSTREVGEVLEPVLGYQPSAQTVSRVAQVLDQAVRRYHWRTLDDDWLYLFLDGIVLKVKHAGGVTRKTILVAYGIRPNGTRQLIDFRLATAESEAQWEAFLRDLKHRGLWGERLQLVVTDGAPGLHKALEFAYGLVPRQRCWVHKLRNVACYLPRKHQQACLREAAAMYQAPNLREATAQFRAWKTHWQPIAPKAVACLERDLPELLAFLACPAAHRVKIRTTNVIERAFREVRRRTRPMSCFQNNRSCERIVYSVMEHLNMRWKDAPLDEITQKA